MSDDIVYDGKFSFDEVVSTKFSDMLRRSIPDYDTMRAITDALCRKRIREGSHVVDVGCSRGDAVAPLVEDFNSVCDFTLIDVSGPMLDICRERFSPIDSVSVVDHDIRLPLPVSDVDVILSVLTVQFTPIEDRFSVYSNMYDALADDGVLLVVEKVLGDTGTTDRMLTDCYYDVKRANGYTEKQIDSKRESLSGVLVPITERWNREMLSSVGFSVVDTYWKCLNFCAFVCLK